MAWESWIQEQAGSILQKAADAKFTQPYEIDRLRLQALGQLGPYTEGEPQGTAQAGALGMSNGALLLIGVGLLAVLMLRD